VYIPSEHQFCCIKLHDVTSQMTVICSLVLCLTDDVVMVMGT
jgi:hypothetical protein